MGYRMTANEAKALFDAKCDIRMSECGGGANNGKKCAELRFSPLNETIATEYADTEEDAWRKAFNRIGEAPSIETSQELQSHNAALQERIKELESQLKKPSPRDDSGSGESEQPAESVANPEPKKRGRPKKAEQPAE